MTEITMKATEQDRTALITGASSGIGLELTRKMLAEGWQIIALNRSEFPDDDPLLRECLSKKQLRVYRADLADFGSLRRALNQIKAAEEKIDVLFNNAGGSTPELTFSKQGRELHFELQTVVPYVVFMELKEQLLRGTLKTVVNTSTSAFNMLRRFDADALERPTAFNKLFGPYSTSKLALSLWTQEIAPLVAHEGIKIRSVDPGGNNTLRKGDKRKSGLPFYMIPIKKLFMPHPSSGASLLYEGAVGANKALSGAFLMKGKPTELKFADQGRKVLDKVRSIYEKEFTAGTKA